MNTKTVYRLASLFVILSLIISANQAAHASSLAASPTTNPIKLAWFYKPPADGNVTLIAQNFNTYIMTKGNETTRDQFLALGASQPMLEYLRFEAIMDPGSCTTKPWQNQVAYLAGDFCNISSQHPDWFLLNTSGKRIMHLTGTSSFYLMNPGSAGWRAFFLERVTQIFAADKSWGGVFLDNVEVTNSFHVKAGENLAAYPDNASFQAAVQGFLQYLRSGFFQPQGKLLYANLIARPDDANFTTYLTYLDGVMHEGWAIDDPNRWRSPTEWEKHMALAEKTQQMGKSIILVSHGTQTDLALQEFAFASYLLIADGKASFRYAGSSAYNQAWIYDNYKLNLGAALGKRYQNGSSWKRDFSNGSVSVDPASHVVSITVKGAAAATATPGSPAPSSTALPPTATTMPAASPTAISTSIPTASPTAVPEKPTATAVSPTAQPTSAPQATKTIYENSDPGFIYTPDWSTVTDGKASGSGYAQTSTLKGSVSFKFSGSSFSFLYLAQPNGGTFKLFIDGKYYHYISQKASSMKYKKTWQLNKADTLAPGPHELKLVFDNPSGSIVTFDQLTVKNP